MPTLLALDQIDPSAVETLLDAAFGADRHGRTAYRLRAGVDWIAALSFAVLVDGMLAGTVQCWPVALTPPEGCIVPFTLLGPVAVDPARQQGGLGKRLTQAAIAAARATGAPPLMLIGDPEYYGRFGFTADRTAGWSLPGPFEPRRLLALVAEDVVLPPTGMIGPDPLACRPETCRAAFASSDRIA